MPNLPLEGHDRKVTASPEHLALARKEGCEGMVLLKNNEGLLPLKTEKGWKSGSVRERRI